MMDDLGSNVSVLYDIRLNSIALIDIVQNNIGSKLILNWEVREMVN